MPLTKEVIKRIKNDNCFNITNKFDLHPFLMKSIAKANATKRECSVRKAVIFQYQIFPRVIFLNSNLPGKRCELLKKKVKIDELPNDSTDIFQYNMLDCCLDQPDKIFKLRQYQIIDQFCFPEFLSLYYTDPRPLESTENNCKQVALNDEIIELNHDDLTVDFLRQFY